MPAAAPWTLEPQDAGEGRARARAPREIQILKSKAVRAVYLSFIIVRNNDTHSTDATRDSRHARFHAWGRALRGVVDVVVPPQPLSRAHTTHRHAIQHIHAHGSSRGDLDSAAPARARLQDL